MECKSMLTNEIKDETKRSTDTSFPYYRSKSNVTIGEPVLIIYSQV